MKTGSYVLKGTAGSNSVEALPTPKSCASLHFAIQTLSLYRKVSSCYSHSCQDYNCVQDNSFISFSLYENIIFGSFCRLSSTHLCFYFVTFYELLSYQVFILMNFRDLCGVFFISIFLTNQTVYNTFCSLFYKISV